MSSEFENVIQKLAQLTKVQWQTSPPANAADIDNLEQDFNVQLPDDYRHLLLLTNGAYIEGFNTVLGLDNIKTLYDLNEDPGINEALPGMFIFAGDGGGGLYFFDPHNRLNKGQYAIFWVHMGNMFLDSATYLDKTLTGLMMRILDNEDVGNV